VVDLLASEFGVPIDEYCLTYAVTAGQDAMIDHLVARYGVDPNMLVSRRWDAIHYAAKSGRTRTVQHLVEKHNADIHAWDDTTNTALDVAEGYNWTDIVSYLREIGATNREPFVPDWGDDGMDSDEDMFSDDDTFSDDDSESDDDTDDDELSNRRSL
jgi:ankyrin repeat protein